MVFADALAVPARAPTRRQTWNASHQSYANGANSGFVKRRSRPGRVRRSRRRQLSSRSRRRTSCMARCCCRRWHPRFRYRSRLPFARPLPSDRHATRSEAPIQPQVPRGYDRRHARTRALPSRSLARLRPAASCRSPTRSCSPLHFPIGAAVLLLGPRATQTYPNRRFLFAGTAIGADRCHRHGRSDHRSPPVANGTIFDRSDAHSMGSTGGSLRTPRSTLRRASLIVKSELADAAARYWQRTCALPTSTPTAAGRTLPRSRCSTRTTTTTSEENPQDIQIGEQFVAGVVNALMHGAVHGRQRRRCSSTTTSTGGDYDHVPPPRGDQARFDRADPFTPWPRRAAADAPGRV